MIYSQPKYMYISAQHSREAQTNRMWETSPSVVNCTFFLLIKVKCLCLIDSLKLYAVIACWCFKPIQNWSNTSYQRNQSWATSCFFFYREGEGINTNSRMHWQIPNTLPVIKLVELKYWLDTNTMTPCTSKLTRIIY